MRPLSRFFNLAPLVALSLVGCQNDASKANSQPDELILADNLSVMDSDDGAALLRVENDGATLVFEGEPAGIVGLSSGDLLASAPLDALPYGMLARVGDISTAGDETRVEIVTAPLSDAIRQGSVTLDAPLSSATVVETVLLMDGATVVEPDPLAPPSAELELAEASGSEGGRRVKRWGWARRTGAPAPPAPSPACPPSATAVAAGPKLRQGALCPLFSASRHEGTHHGSLPSILFTGFSLPVAGQLQHQPGQVRRRYGGSRRGYGGRRRAGAVDL